LFNLKLLFIKKILDKCLDSGFEEVITSSEEFLKVNSSLKVISRYFRKIIYLSIRRQTNLEVETFPIHSRILMIYTKKNYGDAILELSGRRLINHNFIIDLITTSELASFFSQDKIFNRVFDFSKSIEEESYDYVLLTEFSKKAINQKIKLLPRTKFACMFRFFYGPDRNQVYFSHFTVNKIFKLNIEVANILLNARPALWWKDEDFETQNPIQKIGSIALSIGGIDPERIYERWDTLIKHLDNTISNKLRVYLLGSSNAELTIRKISELPLKKIKVISLVGKTSLQQCRYVIDSSDFFVGCDGGMLHVAHTCNTPTLSLFQLPAKYRLTQITPSKVLEAKQNVNEIDPKKILEQLDSIDLKS